MDGETLGLMGVAAGTARAVPFPRRERDDTGIVALSRQDRGATSESSRSLPLGPASTEWLMAHTNSSIHVHSEKFLQAVVVEFRDRARARVSFRVRDRFRAGVRLRVRVGVGVSA